MPKGKWVFSDHVGKHRVQCAVSAGTRPEVWCSCYTESIFIEVKADLKGFSKILHETYCNQGMKHGTSTGTVARPLNLATMSDLRSGV